MGKRKRLRAEKIKEQRRQQAYAILRNYPASPRKMRLIADVIRGKDVEDALNILEVAPQAAAEPIKKLLQSAIQNWEHKRAEETGLSLADLYVERITVDQARTLKRIQPRAQGRAFRIRKRSSHVSIYLGEKKYEQNNNEEQKKQD